MAKCSFHEELSANKNLTSNFAAVSNGKGKNQSIGNSSKCRLQLRQLPEEKTLEKMRWSKGHDLRSQISFGCENNPSHITSVPLDDSRIKCTWNANKSRSTSPHIKWARNSSKTHLVFFFETQSSGEEAGVICVSTNIRDAPSLDIKIRSQIPVQTQRRR